MKLNKVEKHFQYLSDEEFFQAVDLSLPGLELVRIAVGHGNHDKTGTAFVQHLRQRSTMKNKAILLPYDTFQTDHNPDDLCRHVFNIYCERFDLGQDIDWAKNPEEATDSCWAEILNVHNWISTLALVYERTKNEKYAAACAELLADWIAKNPTPVVADSFPPVWPAWSGVVARLGSWLDCFSFFLHSPSFSDRLWLDIIKSMLTQMRYIRKRPTWDQSWILSMGCQSLISLLLPELKESKARVEEGLQRLEELYQEWFYPDGASTFTAIDYHMAFYRWFDGVVRLMLTSGVTPPTWLKEAVEKMLRFIAYTVKPNGEVPMVSDTWRLNVADLLRDDANALNLPDVLYIATSGKEGTAPVGTSCEFPGVGHYIMRSGWDKDVQYLLFDVGPFGHGGHGHQDKLNIIVHAYGRTLISDPGVGSYRDMALGQNSFRRYSTTTRSHNTVTVEWKDQLELNGRIEELPGNKWVSAAAYDFACSVYTEGYGDYHWEELHPRDTFEPIRIVHRRKLFFVKGEYWILSDLLEGEGVHEYESTFQFSPGGASFDPKTKAAWTTDPDAANTMIAPVPDEKLSIRIAKGERDPLLGWVSYNYGDALSAPMAVYTLESAAPCAIDMVILPFRKGKKKPPVSVKRLPVTEGNRELQPEEATCLEISINGKVDYYLISHLPPSLKRFGAFEFDGEVAHIRDKKANVLGGVDVDLLTKGSGQQVRARVREIVRVCAPGGGFALGTGNSVANYIPVENYLTMPEEGRKMIRELAK